MAVKTVWGREEGVQGEDMPPPVGRISATGSALARLGCPGDAAACSVAALLAQTRCGDVRGTNTAAPTNCGPPHL